MEGTAGGSDPPDREKKDEEPVPGSSKDNDTKRKTASDENSARKKPPRKAARCMAENMTFMSTYLNCMSSSESDSSDSVLSSSSSSGSSTSHSFRIRPKRKRDVKSDEESKEIKELLKLPQPEHKWFMIPEILKRPLGSSNKIPGARNFELRAHGSLHTVQRLELHRRLEEHTGCVNCVHFNESGRLLASCSDDRNVCVWHWAKGKLMTTINTTHTSNVFQSKFLPLLGHVNIVTCGRDGRVKHHELCSSGSLRGSHNLGSHEAAAHKLSLVAGSPHCFLSCGEDGEIKMFDIRTQELVKNMTVTENDEPVSLYSIDCHPLKEREFVVGGSSPHLRIYDLRNTLQGPIWRRTVETVRNETQQITCAVYNYNGTEIIASCTKNLYLWDISVSKWSSKEFVHKYIGNRNRSTIKGVNFFGPKSEYIMSGSDCGNIFMWDKETEVIVQFMPGDDAGVVNCLESHPSVPVLATSGLDEDVKIWLPSSESGPDFKLLESTLLKNGDDNYFLFPLRLRLNHDTGDVPFGTFATGPDENGVRVSCAQS